MSRDLLYRPMEGAERPTYDFMVQAQVQFAIDVRNAPNREDAERVVTELLAYFRKEEEGYTIEQDVCDDAVAAVHGLDTPVIVDDARLWFVGEPGPLELAFTDEA